MNRQEIKCWLEFYGIKNYTISDDLVVDVDGGVNLHNRYITVIPFKFGKVTGNFHCSNNHLTTLQNCPDTVGGSFSCKYNKLSSLKYCPAEIGGLLHCGYNPFIVTEENESVWIEYIKKYFNLYDNIPNPSEAITSFYKMVYEV